MEGRLGKPVRFAFSLHSEFRILKEAQITGKDMTFPTDEREITPFILFSVLHNYKTFTPKLLHQLMSMQARYLNGKCPQREQ
jgi:hypothetical protein